MNTFEEKFKKSVQENFDASVEHYERFENKYHLFENLTVKLVELMGETRVSRVLDVGCGTGISTYSLYKNFGDTCSYYALDISNKMLDIAKDKYSQLSNISFIHGDAENLNDYFIEKFEIIFYTASLFLIPNFKKSLADAFSLLSVDGKIGISFYSGLADAKGENLVKKYFPEFSYRYGAFLLEDLTSFLESDKFRHFTTEFLFQSEMEFLNDFLCIPAQAAGLFPRQSYSKQIPLVREFVADLFKMENEIFMKWIFIIITK